MLFSMKRKEKNVRGGVINIDSNINGFSIEGFL
jgi:hypothetical protein